MSSDPNPQGGSLSDMAVEGTKIPSDAGAQRTIPSVPRPDQITDPSNDSNNLGATDLAGAADNAQDISRTTQDTAPTDDIVTGTGDSMPSETASKRLGNLTNADLSKGHGRYDKHVRQKGSDQEQGASEGAAEDEVEDGVVGGRP
ncbi:hypothetical protein P7C71_g3018, partial [Lecanoromycetidae sp. Uapishka_2]